MTKEVTKIELQYRHGKWMGVWQTVVAVCIFAAVVLVLFSAVGFSLPYALSIISGCIFATLFGVFRGKKFGKLAVTLSALGASVLLAVINVQAFAGGMLKFLNQIVAVSNGNMHWGWGHLSNLPTSSFGEWCFASVLCIWLGIGISAISFSRSASLGSGIFFVILLLLLGLFPAPYAVLVLTLTLVARCVAFGGINFKTTMAYFLIFVLLVGVVATSFFYGGDAGIGSFKRSVGDATERMFFGSDSLPQGRLYDAQTLISQDVRLIVTLNEQTPTLYLKGFVGSELVGNEWTATDKNAYVTDSTQGMVDYLANEGFPFTQYSNYLQLCGKKESYTVDIQNVSANAKYTYVPYTLSGSLPGGYNYDMNLSRGILQGKTYSYQISATDSTAERTVQAAWVVGEGSRTDEMKKYLQTDGIYRKFVYDNYLAITDEQRETIRTSLGGQNANSIFSVSRLIRTWYQENYTYATVPDKIHTNFFDDFFDGTIQHCNSVYFASAATLIFRAYNIPARYVEGYYVRAGQLEERTALSVTGRNSHAWTEVYFDGIGWLPIEVTLTFFSDADLDPDINAPVPGEGESKPNVDPVEPEEPISPEKPDDRPEDMPPAGSREEKLYFVLQAATPFLVLLLIVLVLATALGLRRTIVIAHKHKKLKTDGEAYGRAVMKIIDGECNGFYSQKQATQQWGIHVEETNRFIELIERAVYGGYNLSAAEKSYVENYIRCVSDARSQKRGKAYALYCKYIKCMGL